MRVFQTSSTGLPTTAAQIPTSVHQWWASTDQLPPALASRRTGHRGWPGSRVTRPAPLPTPASTALIDWAHCWKSGRVINSTASRSLSRTAVCWKSQLSDQFYSSSIFYDALGALTQSAGKAARASQGGGGVGVEQPPDTAMGLARPSHFIPTATPAQRPAPAAARSAGARAPQARGWHRPQGGGTTTCSGRQAVATTDSDGLGQLGWRPLWADSEDRPPGRLDSARRRLNGHVVMAWLAATLG